LSWSVQKKLTWSIGIMERNCTYFGTIWQGITVLKCSPQHEDSRVIRDTDMARQMSCPYHVRTVF
jgi:hypothetical protein